MVQRKSDNGHRHLRQLKMASDQGQLLTAWNCNNNSSIQVKKINNLKSREHIKKTLNPQSYKIQFIIDM